MTSDLNLITHRDATDLVYWIPRLSDILISDLLRRFSFSFRLLRKFLTKHLVNPISDYFLTLFELTEEEINGNRLHQMVPDIFDC